MDLKRELGKLLNVRPESLAIAEVQDGRMRTVHGVCSLSAKIRRKKLLILCVQMIVGLNICLGVCAE